MLHRSRTIVMALGVLALALVPPAAAALNQPFYIDLFRRMMIFALAALSLDLVLGLLVLFLVLGHRLVNARCGMVIRAAKSNEPRARAIGFSPFRYKLVAFVLAGGACGLAGALLANQTEYLTPEFMHWARSGE